MEGGARLQGKLAWLNRMLSDLLQKKERYRAPSVIQPRWTTEKYAEAWHGCIIVSRDSSSRGDSPREFFHPPRTASSYVLLNCTIRLCVFSIPFCRYFSKIEGSERKFQNLAFILYRYRRFKWEEAYVIKIDFSGSRLKNYSIQLQQLEIR